jgi:hypothetical protein
MLCPILSESHFDIIDALLFASFDNKLLLDQHGARHRGISKQGVKKENLLGVHDTTKKSMAAAVQTRGQLGQDTTDLTQPRTYKDDDEHQSPWSVIKD